MKQCAINIRGLGCNKIIKISETNSNMMSILDSVDVETCNVDNVSIERRKL